MIGISSSRCITFGTVLVPVAVVAGLLIAAPPARAAISPNPIVLENQKPGTSAWQLPWAGMRVADDVGKQIKGYADATSVNIGERLSFKVSVVPAQDYRIHIFRLGYYGGAGGRLIMYSTLRHGTTQPRCPLDLKTGVIECNWSTAWIIAPQPTWVSGLYLAVLTNARKYQNYIPFVVRNDARRADGVVVEPFSNWQAYNEYPRDGQTGRSLYKGAPPIIQDSGTTRAVKVSFDRPYSDHGAGKVFYEAAWSTRWLERSGYDVVYGSSLDLHAGRITLNKYRMYISPGHDEYWSAAMYDRVEAARDAGVSLAYFASDNVYWQVRFEPSRLRQANRVMVCYRFQELDPIKDARTTILWRNVGRPEQQLLGAMYSNMLEWNVDFPWTVKTPTSWMFGGTGLRAGDKIPRLLAGEGDRVFRDVPLPPHTSFEILSESPFELRGTHDGIPDDVSHSVVHRAPSGAWVFNAGTMNWGRLLGKPDMLDSRVQRMTTNLLGNMLTRTGAPAVSRATDPDVFVAAAKLSRATFTSAVPVAYVAHSADHSAVFAAAAAAGRQGGAVALVSSAGIPPATATELRRLAPGRIVVVGTSRTVSDATASALRAFTSGGVTRLAGVDRYTNAAAVASRVWPTAGVPQVYVTLGTSPVDAAPAAAAAAAVGAPVLLTDPQVLPGATATQLARLKPKQIVLVASRNTVASAVPAALARYGPVRVIAGADRYGTAALLSEYLYGANSPKLAYVVGGSATDAVLAATVAGRAGAPLLYTASPRLHPLTALDLRRTDPERITVVAAAGSVADSVLAEITGTFSRGLASATGSGVAPTTTPAPGTAEPGSPPTSTGPTSAGPTSTGPTSTGPTSTGPTSTRPSDTLPSNTGSTSTGPTSTGPTSTGPTSTGTGAG